MRAGFCLNASSVKKFSHLENGFTLQRMIQLKRVYEPAANIDGQRFLVDRLWPRGAKKESLALDGWLKDVAPSNELRKWFGHDPAKWTEFQKRYRTELDGNPAACQSLLAAARRGNLTLLFSAHDTTHNNAIVLKEFLQEQMKSAAK